MKLLLIIGIQLIYVPMLSLRTVCMVKNLKVLTTLFGFLEAIIYIFGLAIVLSGEQNVIEMVVYAFGFAIGLLVGLMIEQKMAIGYSSFEVNINHENPELIRCLREKGYGVTVYIGEGRNGKRLKLDILTKRKYEKALIETVLSLEPEAFIMAYEPKMFRGGYLGEMMKQRRFMYKKNSTKEPMKSYSMDSPVSEIKNELQTIKEEWSKDDTYF